MPQATALDSLIEFARGQRDDALSRFAASVSAARALEQRLALLVNYRDECAGRFAASARGGLSAGQLRGFRLFLEKLDLAIGQQRDAVDSQSEQHRQRRVDWAQRESRLQGYATLRGRRSGAGATLARRAEQRGTDDHARRAAARAAEEQ